MGKRGGGSKIASAADNLLAGEETVIPWAEGNDVWDRIHQLAGTLPCLDLLTFFVQNPYTCDTAAGLAVCIGYRPAQIQPILDQLVEAQLLKVSQVGSLCVYELTDDPRCRQVLQQYVSWVQEGYHWARIALTP